MLNQIHPKLPMRNVAKTKDYYVNQLGFTEIADYGNYLIVKKDHVEMHFFEHTTLIPTENYGQVYLRTDAIDVLYQQWLDSGVTIHPGGSLETKSWGQKEFSLLDPDHNLLTFGQGA